VRNGANSKTERDKQTHRSTHKLFVVYREMLLQICRDYPGLAARFETLPAHQIRSFYEGLRRELHERTKAK
jgi:hypothetical protein